MGEGLSLIHIFPNLDLMMDAADAAGFLRVGVNVRFDAFVTERTYRHACEQYASEIAVDVYKRQGHADRDVHHLASPCEVVQRAIYSAHYTDMQ